MRTLGFLAALATALSPAMFAQARGGRPVMVRRPAPTRVISSAPGPVIAPAARPVAPGVALVPVGFFGYYPNPLPADPSAYANGYAPGPPPDGAPPPAYYGADPSGQGYPSVLINPNYAPDTANPVIRDYSFPSDSGGDSAVQPPPAPQILFLIAMKDHTIYPAVAYWVQDDNLNYITQQGVRIQVSLELVDRDFSVQLNKERNIDFALPDPKAN